MSLILAFVSGYITGMGLTWLGYWIDRKMAAGPSKTAPSSEVSASKELK